MDSLHSQLKSGAHRHFGQGARLLKRIVLNAISGGWHADLGPFRIGSWLLRKTWRNLTFTSTFTFCQIDIYILVNRHLHRHLQSTPDGSKPTFTWVISLPGQLNQRRDEPVIRGGKIYPSRLCSRAAKRLRTKRRQAQRAHSKTLSVAYSLLTLSVRRGRVSGG